MHERATRERSVASFSDSGKRSSTVQCKGYQARTGYPTHPVQRVPNNTGLPDTLKVNVENLSGYSMDDVQVHYNSSKPAELNALAYAQGTNIHVAPGREKHLPHEAWHVVQQKQGRVRATMQMKGGVGINDNKGLEKEADMMGRKATHAKKNTDTIQFNSPKPLDSSVVQRAVGFEFETGWLVSLETSLGNFVPLKKKNKIGFTQFDGFKLEADEAGDNLSEVEFIVYPPIDEGPEGLIKLDDVMSDMEMFGQTLEAKGGGGKSFALNTVTGNQRDKMFMITPTDDRKLTAGPQVTSGLDLGKIEKLKTIDEDLKNFMTTTPASLHNSDESPAPPELKPAINYLADTAVKIISVHGNISPNLRGLLTLIVSYIKAGADPYKNEDLDEDSRHRHAYNYPKRIADILLARTDFGRLFKFITPGEQRYYAAHPDLWIQLIMKNLPEYIHKDDSIIQRGIKMDENDPSKGVIIPDLKISEWLTGMLLEIDRLRTHVNDAESMGEFKGKTEKVGGNSIFSSPIDVGIFEFREAQKNKMPLLRWKPFSIEFLKYISYVHDQ